MIDDDEEYVDMGCKMYAYIYIQLAGWMDGETTGWTDCVWFGRDARFRHGSIVQER